MSVSTVIPPPPTPADGEERTGDTVQAPFSADPVEAKLKEIGTRKVGVWEWKKALLGSLRSPVFLAKAPRPLLVFLLNQPRPQGLRAAILDLSLSLRDEKL